MVSASKPKIVVLGGGFAGLESAFYLRKRVRDNADITVVSADDRFLFKPNTIYIPFGTDPASLTFPLEPAVQKKDISLVHARAGAIDPDKRLISLDGGEKIEFDYLVVATGAAMRPEEVPGLGEHASSIWTTDDMLRLRRSFQEISAAAESGARRRVLFLVPRNNKCSGPLYEMVQMLETWLRGKGVRQTVDITYSTHETAYIQVFGPRLDDAVAQEFDRRDISGHRGYAVQRVEDGVAHYENGRSLPYDLLVTLPPYIASTPFENLPADDRGFIATDPASRRVAGYPNIFAVGDAADFPVKQAFLAFLEADAAAEHLSAEILGRQPAFDFEPTSMCVMEQFDKATFAQVPLRLTGEPDRPVEIRSEHRHLYRVGSSRSWKLGKKLLGLYLPWRLKSGEPFHAGFAWSAMELGLKGMSRLLAS